MHARGLKRGGGHLHKKATLSKGAQAEVLGDGPGRVHVHLVRCLLRVPAPQHLHAPTAPRLWTSPEGVDGRTSPKMPSVPSAVAARTPSSSFAAQDCEAECDRIDPGYDNRRRQFSWAAISGGALIYMYCPCWPIGALPWQRFTMRAQSQRIKPAAR